MRVYVVGKDGVNIFEKSCERLKTLAVNEWEFTRIKNSQRGVKLAGPKPFYGQAGSEGVSQTLIGSNEFRL